MLEKIFETTFSIIEGTLKTGYDLLEAVVTGIPKKKEGYKAEFASQGTLFSSRHYGFCLTGNKNLSVKNSYTNALIIGGTGVGKSSTYFKTSTGP